ncbi:unnamed protein product [Clonostachys rosea]|uniref:Uncharacterized protein n=1 Tax=Bionectria ochroleuca TaxID=29856 RepID=A0ABY6UJ27_BIOOC|nr:unnamed protein product [Clonostachys rosea]
MLFGKTFLLSALVGLSQLASANPTPDDANLEPRQPFIPTCRMACAAGSICYKGKCTSKANVPGYQESVGELKVRVPTCRKACPAGQICYSGGCTLLANVPGYAQEQQNEIK